jgi:hypothetical protein
MAMRWYDEMMGQDRGAEEDEAGQREEEPGSGGRTTTLTTNPSKKMMQGHTIPNALGGPHIEGREGV